MSTHTFNESTQIRDAGGKFAGSTYAAADDEVDFSEQEISAEEWAERREQLLDDSRVPHVSGTVTWQSFNGRGDFVARPAADAVRGLHRQAADPAVGFASDSASPHSSPHPNLFSTPPQPVPQELPTSSRTTHDHPRSPSSSRHRPLVGRTRRLRKAIGRISRRTWRWLRKLV